MVGNGRCPGVKIEVRGKWEGDAQVGNWDLWGNWVGSGRCQGRKLEVISKLGG